MDESSHEAKSLQSARDALTDLITQSKELNALLAAQAYSDRVAGMRVRLLNLQGRLINSLIQIAQSRRPTRSQEVLPERAKRLLEQAKKLTGENKAASPPPAPAVLPKGPARNAPCPCGSKVKWKKCCGAPEKAAA